MNEFAWPRWWSRLLVIVKNRCVRPLWFGLIDLGRMMWAPMEATQAPEQQRPPQRVATRRKGLPPGHPERLRPDLPLSQEERLLARELFPYHLPHHPDDPGLSGG